MQSRKGELDLTVTVLDETTLQFKEGTSEWEDIEIFTLPSPTENTVLDATTSVYLIGSVLGPKPTEEHLMSLIKGRKSFKHGNLGKYDLPFFNTQKNPDSHLTAMSCEAVAKRFIKKIAEDFQRNPSKTECTSLRLTKCTNDEDDPMYSSGDIFGMRLVRRTAGSFLPQSAQVDIGTHNRVKWLDREEAASWYHAVDKEDEFGLPKDGSSTWRM